MPKQIKLVAVDLDRTLLHSDGTISAFTVEVFRRLQRCQIKVCVLTARRKASAEPICKQLACQGAAFYNGAMVCANKDVISLHTMNLQTAKSILSAARDHPCSVSCKDGRVYTNFETQHSTRLDCWEQLPEQELLRVVLYKAPQALLEQVKAVSNAGLYIQQLAHGDIVVVSQTATKEQALKTLLKYWKLSPGETVGFGDDANDLGFLSLVGTGIAVQNAEEQVKQYADIVCSRNDENGPALWLNEHILKPLGTMV